VLRTLRKRFIAVAAVFGAVAALLVIAAPASANSKPTTGPRLPLFGSVTTFPANTPFNVEQGFTCVLGDGSCIGKFISAQSSSTLYVDGVLQPSTVDVDVYGGTNIERRWLTNFPNGLPAGDHTFVDVFTFGDGSGGFTLEKTITFT